MNLNTRDYLTRFAIYLLPLTAFQFQEGGYGIIQLSLPIVLLLFVISISKVTSLKSSLEKSVLLKIAICFFLICIFSTSLSIYLGEENSSLYKSLGVLTSLAVFFASYYSFSTSNKDIYRTSIFLRDYFNISLFISAMVILEFLIHKVSGNNYIYDFMNYFRHFIPYPKAQFLDLTSLGRYKGILNETGELGLYTLPSLSAYLSGLSISKRNLVKDVVCIVLFSFSTFLANSFVFNALLILIFSLAFLRSRSQFQRSLIAQKVIRTVLGIVAVIVSLSIVYYFQNYLSISVQERISDLQAFYETGYYDNSSNLSVQVILNSYKATVYSLQKNFLIGIGLGNIDKPYNVVATAQNISTRLNQHDGYSMLFRLLSETGITGTLLFLSFSIFDFPKDLMLLFVLRQKSLFSALKANTVRHYE
ncbi:MAG: hypothetical protein HC908_04085 [Calothrix sp. SM1_7_51]|nr:hypothetical protein [Calothrix sp. SM1_7_51]